MSFHKNRRRARGALVSALTGTLVACTSDTTAPPRLPTPSATALFAVDFDGDGNDEIATVQDDTLHWMGNKVALAGAVAADASVDLDGDGSEELVVALRRSRAHPNAKPQLLVLDADGARPHSLPQTDRHRITDLSPYGSRLFVTVLGSGKKAIGGWWTPDSFETVTESTMGMSQQVVSAQSIAVGRIYGDTPKSNGRLELHTGADKRVLPSRRGIRTVATADINRDGHADIVAADGWHFKYGEHAEARLSLYLGPEFSDYRVIGTIDGDYTINRIDVVSTTPPIVVATGTSKVVAFTLDELGWTPITIGTTKEGAHATVLKAKAQHWVALPGESIQIRELSSL